MGDFVSFLGNNLVDFWGYTGFANATPGHLFMLLIGLFFIYLAVAKEFEPMLLIPIGFGILIGNIPFNMEAGLKVGIYEEGSVLNILYQGVTSGWYPPLIFLGIGAMTDFSALISNPKLMLIGAAAQFGIFGAYIIALLSWVRTQPGGCYRYHWRCRRTDGHLPFVQTGSQPDGCHRCVSLFLHGAGAGDTATYHACANHQTRASDPHETTENSIAYGKSNLPHRGSVAYMLPGSFGSAFAGYAVLR